MLLSALLVVCALGLASGQEDLTCSALNVEAPNDNPFSGNALSVCQTPSVQCCTQAYLNRVQENLGEELLESLRDQIGNSLDVLEDVLEGFEDYFEGGFLQSIRGLFPGGNLIGGDLSDITRGLERLLNRANFSISTQSPDFDTRTIFSNILRGVEDAIRGSSLFNPTQQECLINRIQASINQASLNSLGRTMEVIRRSFTGVSRISDFLDDFDDNVLDRFTVALFPRQCIRRLAELHFCGRCTRRLPPLCSNTCGALVRGCFAAYYSGLEAEFNNLWMVVRDLIAMTDTNIRMLFESERDFLGDLNPLTVVAECGLGGNPFSGRRKRQATENFLPGSIAAAARRLTGVFTYEASGPRFCRVDDDERDFCNGEEEDDRSCDSDEVCTSTCQCWDGEGQRPQNTMQFTGITIDEQAENPVLTVPVEEYRELASQLGTPVNSFLTSSEFEDIMPEGLTIPEAAPFGSGSIPIVSMVTFLGALVFALFV